MNTLQEISSLYQEIAGKARLELNRVQQQIYRIGTLRLLIFLVGIVGVIYFWSEDWIVPAAIAIITLLPFVLLIKYHNRLFVRKEYLEKKIEVNEQEIAALEYDTSAFED